MTKQEWLTCEEPHKMLSSYYVLGEGKPQVIVASTYQGAGRSEGIRISDRKIRLFACGCCRQVWDKLTDPRDRRDVKVAEQHMDGLATKEEFDWAHERYIKRHQNNHSETWLLGTRCFWDTRWIVEGVERSYPYLAPAIQANVLREIMGNPWKPFPYSWIEGNLYAHIDTAPDPPRKQVLPVPWLTPTVLGIARHAYDERDFAALPVLADALEEAGCDSEDLLRHLRGQEMLESTRKNLASSDHPKARRMAEPTPHVRGCWTLDLILGKE